MEQQLQGPLQKAQQTEPVSGPMEIPSGAAPRVSCDAGQSRAGAPLLGRAAAGQQGRTDSVSAAQGQQEQQQGETTGDSASKAPPALERVSIASAIGELHPPLSRHVIPLYCLPSCACAHGLCLC